jgi:6-phosphofructokinase 1
MKTWPKWYWCFSSIGGDGTLRRLIIQFWIQFSSNGIPGTIDNDILERVTPLGTIRLWILLWKWLIKLETPQVLITDWFCRSNGEMRHTVLNRYWCRSRRNINSWRRFRIRPPSRIATKSKASGKSSSIVVIAEGDKIGKTYLNWRLCWSQFARVWC